jgi:hypothetical protein
MDFENVLLNRFERLTWKIRAEQPNESKIEYEESGENDQNFLFQFLTFDAQIFELSHALQSCAKDRSTVHSEGKS